MKRLVLIALALTPLFTQALASEADRTEGRKSVLITGASSGLGRATAEHLSAKGYFVYAGARKNEDLQELNKLDNVMAVRLDVTNQDQIDAAVRLIEEQGTGLWGLVNNAGVGDLAPLIAADVADIQFVFDVNVFGVFRITKAFAPLIIESRGRIVNISSISGVLSVGTAGMYAGSKHAVEAMTDSLSEELQGFGVHVSAVNPGGFRSEIDATSCKRMLADINADWGLFEERRQEMLGDCRRSIQPGSATRGMPPIAMINAVEHALIDEKPRSRYLVVSKQIEAADTIVQATKEMLRLNGGHNHSYTRDEIVGLVDDIWPFAVGEKSWATVEEEWAFIDAWDSEINAKRKALDQTLRDQ